MCRVQPYHFILSFALLISATVTAQVKISVIPSKTVVQQNETFQLQFDVEGTTEVDEFKAPSFRNFEQMSRLEQTNGWTWVNGSLTEYVSYSILLRAKIKGKLPIASAIVKAKGKVITSAPLVIFVTDAIVEEEKKSENYLLPGENAKEKIAKNLFVKATVDKHTCYVGETILATFKLFTRLDIESKIVKRPSLNGFSVIDLEQPEAGIFSKEMLNGKIFNCYLIRKVQLFPLQAGELSIEPLEIENVVRMIKAKTTGSKETGAWLDAMMEKMKEAEISSENIIEEKAVWKSNEMKVNVLELPEKNKPETFNGAVGKFTMEAGLLNDRIAANDNATLRITIKGNGNLPMITAPTVNWPAGVDSFEANMQEDIDKTTSPISGTKTFDIPFSVSKTGLFEIPVIRFSYFDEKTKTYQTLSTQPLSLHVTDAVKQKTVVNNDEQTSVTKKGTVAWVWLAGGGGVILLAAGIFFFVIRKQPSTEKINAVAAQQKEEVLKPQKTIAEFLHPAVHVQDGLHHKQFYTLLLEAVQEFFIEKLQIGSHHISNSFITYTLKQKQYNELAVQFQKFAAECEMKIFSGIEMSNAKDQLLLAAIELMGEAERRV